MIEANNETLKDILLNKGVMTKSTSSALISDGKGVSASFLMPKIDAQSESININAGTNFIKDITELVKSTTEFLNTDLGKFFIKRLKGESDVNKEEMQLKSISSARYEQDINRDMLNKDDLKKSEVNVKMVNECDCERRAEEIIMFSIYLIDNVVSSKKEISGFELLEELKRSKEESIKVLKEVLRENDKKN